MALLLKVVYFVLRLSQKLGVSSSENNLILLAMLLIAEFIFGPGRRVPKRYSSCLLLVLGIGSLKILKAFLICSAAQRNFAHTFVLIFPIYSLRFSN